MKNNSKERDSTPKSFQTQRRLHVTSKTAAEILRSMKSLQEITKTGNNRFLD
jgi:hypothetical protein